MRNRLRWPTLLERLLILCDRQEFHETVWKTIALDLLRFSGVSQMEARKTQACYVGRVGRIPAKLAKLSDDVFFSAVPSSSKNTTNTIGARKEQIQCPNKGLMGCCFQIGECFGQCVNFWRAMKTAARPDSH